METAMRRKDRQLSSEDALRILEENQYGVLSTVCEDGEPYGVPMNYAYEDGRVYFHCAPEGRKLASLARCAKASFCVVGKTELLPSRFSTKYESAIVFGRVRALAGEEKTNALRKLIARLAPEYLQAGEAYIGAAQMKTHVFCLEIERLTGKARR